MFSVLLAAITGRAMLQVFTLVQVMGYSISLILMVLASTGASPVMVIRLLLLVMTLVPLSLKTAASSMFRRARMAARWPEMNVLASPNAERGVTPLARNA